MVFPTMVYMGLKRIFRYPWGLLLSVVIDPIILILNIMLFRTIFAYSGKADIAGYSLEGMIWYFAAVSFMWYWIYNFTDYNISRRIISGDLTLDLVRPLSVFSLELSRAVSLRVSGVIFEFLPTLLIYCLVVRHPFITAATLFQFCVSAAIAFLLFYSINFLIGLMANYLQSSDAISAIKYIAIAAPGGSLVPLEFFPAPIASVLRILPASSLFYWPPRFFLGQAGGWIGFGLRSAISLAWVAFFIFIDLFLWKKAVRRFSGFGG
jgi:ABC-2 type transport system permease protein